MTPYEAYQIATNAQKRMPELEPIILQDTASSYCYAKDVIKGRWSEAEPAIMQDACFAAVYARDVIQGRWPEAEPLIASSAKDAYCYAKDVLNKRWAEVELIILQNEYYTYQYARYVIKGRWYEVEDMIAKSAYKDDYIKAFFSEQAVTRYEVSDYWWKRHGLTGYFAPASLFNQKPSLLDIMVSQ